MGIQIGGVVSGDRVCGAGVQSGGPRGEELALSGKVGCAVVRLPSAPCLVGAGQGFPVIRGKGEVVGG